MLLPFTYPFSFKIWVLSLDVKLLWYIDGRPFNFVQLMCRTPHQIAITALRSRVLFWISRIWKNDREQEPGPKCDSISWPHGPEPGSFPYETIFSDLKMFCHVMLSSSQITFPRFQALYRHPSIFELRGFYSTMVYWTSQKWGSERDV